MNTYILQNGEREDLRTILAKNWDAVEDLINAENKLIRNAYFSGNISRKELEKTVIQYAKGKKRTLYI